MIFVVGASSLHHSLEKWRNISQRLHLSKKVITKPGYNVHPQTADKSKVLERRVKFLPFSALIIPWHDLMNNSLTHSPNDPWTPWLPTNWWTPDIYKELKATGIPVLHIVKNLLSKRKSKDESVLRSYSKLHLRHFLEIKTQTIVRKYGSNLKTIIKKKQSPSEMQKRKNQSLKSIWVIKNFKQIFLLKPVSPSCHFFFFSEVLVIRFLGTDQRKRNWQLKSWAEIVKPARCPFLVGKRHTCAFLVTATCILPPNAPHCQLQPSVALENWEWT